MRILIMMLSAALMSISFYGNASAAACGESGHWRAGKCPESESPCRQTIQVDLRERSDADDWQYRLVTLEGGWDDDWEDTDISWNDDWAAIDDRYDQIFSQGYTHSSEHHLALQIGRGGTAELVCRTDMHTRRDGTITEARFRRAECASADDYKVQCSRNYNPEKRRYRIRFSIEDK